MSRRKLQLSFSKIALLNNMIEMQFHFLPENLQSLFMFFEISIQVYKYIGLISLHISQQ